MACQIKGELFVFAELDLVSSFYVRNSTVKCCVVLFTSFLENTYMCTKSHNICQSGYLCKISTISHISELVRHFFHIRAVLVPKHIPCKSTAA